MKIIIIGAGGVGGYFGGKLAKAGNDFARLRVNDRDLVGHVQVTFSNGE